MTGEHETGSHRADIHTLADAIARAGADYRSKFRQPPDTRLTLGASAAELPGVDLEQLAQLLAPHYIDVWTPGPAPRLICLGDDGLPAEPTGPPHTVARLLLWAGDLVAERTGLIDLGGST